MLKCVQVLCHNHQVTQLQGCKYMDFVANKRKFYGKINRACPTRGVIHVYSIYCVSIHENCNSCVMYVQINNRLLSTDNEINLSEKSAEEVVLLVNEAARDINYYMQKAPFFEFTILNDGLVLRAMYIIICSKTVSNCLKFFTVELQMKKFKSYNQFWEQAQAKEGNYQSSAP